MNIYPAIDLRGGQAVRLFQGDYDQMTVYNADPVAQAKLFLDAGAKYLHVVDLDGAKDDTTANRQTIAAIAALTAAFWARWPSRILPLPSAWRRNTVRASPWALT